MAQFYIYRSPKNIIKVLWEKITDYLVLLKFFRYACGGFWFKFCVEDKWLQADCFGYNKSRQYWWFKYDGHVYYQESTMIEQTENYAK